MNTGADDEAIHFKYTENYMDIHFCTIPILNEIDIAYVLWLSSRHSKYKAKYIQADMRHNWKSWNHVTFHVESACLLQRNLHKIVMLDSQVGNVCVSHAGIALRGMISCEDRTLISAYIP